jgi:hypothetical protein
MFSYIFPISVTPAKQQDVILIPLCPLVNYGVASFRHQCATYMHVEAIQHSSRLVYKYVLPRAFMLEKFNMHEYSQDNTILPLRRNISFQLALEFYRGKICIAIHLILQATK